MATGIMLRAGVVFVGALLVLRISVAAAQAGDDSTRARAKRPVPALTKSQSRKDVPGRDSESDVLRTVLNQRVRSIEWEKKPLKDVFQWVRDQAPDGHGPINVVPRWRVLKEAGAYADDRVSLVMEHTTVGEILVEAMDQLSGSLMYRGMGGTLRISTKEDFARDMYIKRYELRLLIDYSLGMDDPRVIRGGARDLAAAIRILEDAVCPDISRLILNLIEPSSWSERGGPGVIVCGGTTIVIVNSPEVHEMIGGPFRLEDATPAGKAKPRPPVGRKEGR